MKYLPDFPDDEIKVPNHTVRTHQSWIKAQGILLQILLQKSQKGTFDSTKSLYGIILLSALGSQARKSQTHHPNYF